VKIGINLLGLLPDVIGGGETYIRGLLYGLNRLDTDDEYVLFTNRDNHSTFADVGPRFRRVLYDFSAQWNVPALAMTRVIGEQFYLPWRAALDRLDVIHSTLDTVPLFARCPSVMTLHDVNFAAMPEATNPAENLIARTLVKTSARRARAILTVSEFSRREIAATLNVDPARIFAVHNGGLRDAQRSAKRPQLASIVDIQEPYVLAFSSVNPHKNIGNLIRAFARVRLPPQVQLVVIGRMPMGGESLAALARTLGIENKVSFTGYLKEEEKTQVLQHARMLAFPSLYEGFGLPVIEAMSYDVPVACSNVAALPEVAGNAARMFDPRNVDEITAALEEVLSDEPLRARLIAAGRINARRFSWERTARLTLQVYRYAAGAEFTEHLPAEQLPAEPLPAGPSEWEEATTPAAEG
jgi:glycosyltransferase involved in cell wall biosynthesis